jgi:hypothetical protein
MLLYCMYKVRCWSLVGDDQAFMLGLCNHLPMPTILLGMFNKYSSAHLDTKEHVISGSLVTIPP